MIYLQGHLLTVLYVYYLRLQVGKKAAVFNRESLSLELHAVSSIMTVMTQANSPTYDVFSAQRSSSSQIY